jgi:hypothetical protein
MEGDDTHAGIMELEGWEENIQAAPTENWEGGVVGQVAEESAN